MPVAVVILQCQLLTPGNFANNILSTWLAFQLHLCMYDSSWLSGDGYVNVNNHHKKIGSDLKLQLRIKLCNVNIALDMPHIS